MSATEFLLGFFLALILVALALYFGRRQFQTLRALRTDPALVGEERRYLRGQVYRRLLCSVLMIVFAGLLVGWFFVAENLVPAGPAEAEAGREHVLLKVFAYYWIPALLILFGILLLAAFDFFATARYGMHQKKLLNIEHRANLELDATRIRRQRQEGNGDG